MVDLAPTGLPHGQRQVVEEQRAAIGMPSDSSGLGGESPAGGAPPVPMSGPLTPPDPGGDPILALPPPVDVSPVPAPSRQERAVAILQRSQNPMMRLAAQRVLERRGIASPTEPQRTRVSGRDGAVAPTRSDVGRQRLEEFRAAGTMRRVTWPPEPRDNG